MAPTEMALSQGPLYVAEPSFIPSSFTQALDEQTPQKTRTATPYRPGEMLAESAHAAAAFGQQFADAALGSDMMCQSAATYGDVADPGVESDCSTTDSANDAVSPMQIPSMDPSAFGYMMPSTGMMTESWAPYAPPGYWLPYPAVPAQPEQAWPQMPSKGSSGHRLGRCKPCAFLHRDGCRSGTDCPYCHLCPPGEKQRRKRVMRAMQRNMESHASAP